MTVDYTNSFARGQRQGFNEGLREFMLRVYNYMGMGLLVTAVTSYLVLNVPVLSSLIFSLTPNGNIVGLTMLYWALPFLSLGINFYFSSAALNMSPSTATGWFIGYAVLKGFWLSPITMMYTGESLVSTFLVCASLFGATSLYGYSTKKDLTSMGSFLFMGLIGLIIALVVNIFMQNEIMDLALSAIGVLIFTGLTAWETQKLKSIYFQVGGGQIAKNYAIIGAFSLYLSFINMFIFLLRFLGDRRN